jgi:hypothetical protein
MTNGKVRQRTGLTRIDYGSALSSVFELERVTH